MRFHWLLFSFLGVFLFCSPAQAGKILSWEFKTEENNLVFITDENVQPKAQLINNPTRVVIDLPGTKLGRGTVKEEYQGAIRGFRIGQPEANMSRIVIELAPGYTLDAQEVKFQGISPTQWSVDLPQPRIAPTTTASQSDTSNSNSLPTIEPPSSLPSSAAETESVAVAETDNGDEDDRNEVAITSLESSPYLRATRNGFFVDIEGSRKNQITTNRDGERVEFDLEGVTLPQDLIDRSIAVNQYGVTDIEFSQTSTSPPQAKMSLNLVENSPDWLATFSRIKGLILVPRGTLPESLTTSEVETKPETIEPEPIESTPAPIADSSERSSWEVNLDKDKNKNKDLILVDKVELVEDDTQLRVNGDRDLTATTTKQGNGIYEVRIENAELADDFEGPQLKVGSPISQIRVRQEGATVLMTVTTKLRYRLGQISPENEAIAFPIHTAATLLPDSGNPILPSQAIDVPPAEARTPFPASIPSNRTVVVIDPGHGGQDPGTIGIGGLQEKDIVLPISLDVADILRRQGIEVRMTRDTDNFISLQGRTDFANNIDADLFVSIHANAINLSRPDVNGLETYYYKNGRRLAEVIHWSILNGVDIANRGIRRARFYVLRHSTMPAVLVEVGFVTGEIDAPKLKDPAHRRQMAEAIARGIVQYIKQNKL